MRWLYRNLLAVRPAPLAVLLKRALRIKRRVVPTDAGQRFWVDPVSHFGNEILETRHYEPELAGLLKTLLQPGDTLVDVGANEGYFTVLGAGFVGPAGRVLAIEPQSRLVPVIRENLRLNARDNVALFHSALGQKDGETVLHLTADTNTGATSFHRHWRFGQGTERVPTTTLEGFFQRNGVKRARVLKLDCEGAELDIMLGAGDVLRKKLVDFISVDFHPAIVGPESPVRIDRMLRDSGYQLTAAGTGIWVYHLPGLESALAPLGPMKPVAALVA